MSKQKAEWRNYHNKAFDPTTFTKNKVKSDLIEKCIQEFIINVPDTDKGSVFTDLSFYGEFLLMVDFFETKDIPTAGVNFSKTGMNFYYNPDFIQGVYDNHKNYKQLFFLMIHEIQHLLSNHPTRRFELNHEPELANWAMDMIINDNIVECYNPRNLTEEIESLDPETGKTKVSTLRTPPEYKGEPIYEYLYEWLEEERKKVKKEINKMMSKNSGGSNSGNGSGNSDKSLEETLDDMIKERQQAFDDFVKQDAKNPNLSDQMKSTRKMMAAKELQQDLQAGFDAHIQDEVDPEKREAMRESMESSLRTRGLIKGNISAMLERLTKKRHNYFKDVKRAIKSMMGSNKTRTFTRPNRKEFEGIKGRKKYAEAVNVLLDTSGSMSDSFEKVLSYINGQKVICNIVQCDTEVQDKVRVIKTKKDLANFEIKGLGGTILQPGLDLIKKSKQLKQLNTVILTDGYTDILDCSNMSKVLILTVEQPCPIKSSRANVKQIVLPKDTKL